MAPFRPPMGETWPLMSLVLGYRTKVPPFGGVGGLTHTHPKINLDYPIFQPPPPVFAVESYALFTVWVFCPQALIFSIPPLLKAISKATTTKEHILTDLELIPLGGLGEVGNNMILLRYQNDAIMIDCGLMFPPSDLLGVDIIIPDITFLRENPDLLKAIFITHGHEDHIGALPYVLRELKVPVYATRLTCGFIENKLRNSRGLTTKDIDLREINNQDQIQIGPFRVEPFHVSHSIPDAVGVAVHTPRGLVIHTAEYKFDPEPYSGLRIDEARLRAYGEQGVLALLSDSTNAERFGATPSEQTVYQSLDEIFSEASGRVIVATFASNIHRVQIVADLALRHNRQLSFVGRSMVENSRIARNLGYLTIPDDMIIPLDRLHNLPPHKVAVVCTGTQGERNSALVRMANGRHHQIRIDPSDTIIISATTIPGNEEFVHRNLDNLFRLGANVIYQSIRPVHVSGHASRDGQKQMIALTKPRYFIPIQGEYRMLALHGKLAEEAGIPTENVIIIENGQPVSFQDDGFRYSPPVFTGRVFVDGVSVGDVDSVVLRDRSNLSRDGFITCVVAVDEYTGELIEGPNIFARGFAFQDDETLFNEAEEVVIEALARQSNQESSPHPDTISTQIHDALVSFFYRRTRRRPMILPSVLEI